MILDRHGDYIYLHKNGNQVECYVWETVYNTDIGNLWGVIWEDDPNPNSPTPEFMSLAQLKERSESL